MTDDIPLIDLGPLLRGQDGGLQDVSRAIGAACRGTGFFYVTGHGIPDALMRAVFDQSARLFAAPRELLNSVALSSKTGNRGYVPIKGEALDPSKPADLKEAFNIGLDLPPDDPDVMAGRGFRATNLWPDLPGFRETLLSYFAACHGLGQALHQAFSTDLGLPPDYFADKLDRPMATLRLLHYPERPPTMEKGQFGAGEHTDYGCVTLLLTDDAGGLQVRRRDGVWLDAPYVPGAMVCNIGDCLMRWTNDIYASTPHRVVNPAGRERYSVAFFLDPNPDALVACLPGCEEPGQPPRHAPIRAEEYLLGRLRATYAGAGLMP